MTVLRNQGRWDRSNVIYDAGRVVLYDKCALPGMQYIDYGLSCFRRDLFDSPTPSDLATLFHQLSIQGRLAGFEVHERFYEIGSPAGLHDFEEYLSAPRTPQLVP
jgi:NDP-sugar pyrophosphorylase family protein